MEDIYEFINKNTDLDKIYTDMYLDICSLTKTEIFPQNILKQNLEDITKSKPIENKKIGGSNNMITVFLF